MTTARFQGHCLPCLIGSLPLTDYAQAARQVWEHTPEIPLWVQLPKLPGESITRQFAAGMPGLTEAGGRVFIDAAGSGFALGLLEFYEEALALQGEAADLDRSRFAMTADAAGGFFELIDQAVKRTPPPLALKGQIIGPVTFGTSICDQSGKAIFYDPQLREVSVQLLSLRARWQVRRLAALGRAVLLFIDDPAITGFGSSVYIGLSREDIAQSLGAMIESVHSEGGLAGVHICANADWTLVLESGADILSLDAYAFFDQFVIYREAIRRFLERGGLIAWGLVPTLSPADLERETAESLLAQWEAKSARVAALGIDRERLMAQSLITPACGMGTLSVELAMKALRLTRELSNRIRTGHGAQSIGQRA
jgi:methionine synthase II (cobalamin-independent)